MKPFIATTLILFLAVAGARASAELVKQKAIQQREVNNAQQGVAPANSPGSSTAPFTQPAQQGISPAQQQLVDKLAADLAAIKSPSTVTMEQKVQLQTDIANLAKGAVKPSRPAIVKLVNDLTGALSEKNVFMRDHAQLSRDINIVVNSMALMPDKAVAFVTASQTVLKSGSVKEASLQTISTDLKAIVTELQKGKSKLYQ